MFNAHYCTHQFVRRLRKFFGHSTSECARCTDYESRRGTWAASRTNLQPTEFGRQLAEQYQAVYDQQKTILSAVLPQARVGINRTFYEYVGDGIPRAKEYVTKLFNAYCADNGVQCTVTLDPNDQAQLFYFTNVGNREVMVSHLNEGFTISPGQSATMKIRYSGYALSEGSRLPVIRAVPVEA